MLEDMSLVAQIWRVEGITKSREYGHSLCGASTCNTGPIAEHVLLIDFSELISPVALGLLGHGISRLLVVRPEGERLVLWAIEQ